MNTTTSRETKPAAVRFRLGEYTRLRQIADANDVRLSDVIRALVREALQRAEEISVEKGKLSDEVF